MTSSPRHTLQSQNVIALYSTGGKNVKHESVSDSSNISNIAVRYTRSIPLCPRGNITLSNKPYLHSSCSNPTCSFVFFRVCQNLLLVALNLPVIKKTLNASRACLHTRKNKQQALRLFNKREKKWSSGRWRNLDFVWYSNIHYSTYILSAIWAFRRSWEAFSRIQTNSVLQRARSRKKWTWLVRARWNPDKNRENRSRQKPQNSVFWVLASKGIIRSPGRDRQYCDRDYNFVAETMKTSKNRPM